MLLSHNEPPVSLNSVHSAHALMFPDIHADPYEKSLNDGLSYKYRYIIFSPASSFHFGRNLGEVCRAEGG